MAEIHKLSPRIAQEMDADDAALKHKTLLKSDKGAIKPCEHNARVLLSAAPQYEGLHFDEFLSRMRLGERDWTDADDLDMLCWLQSAYNVPGFSLTHSRNAARTVAYSRRRDSLREFIEALPEWDGIARIEFAFADAWGARDDLLTRAASHHFFVALIARGLRPGAQVDTVWCFEGAQGTNKSRALRALGGPFHAELTAAINTTDYMRELRGLWIAELSELDSLRGKEASTIKRLLSAPTDRFVQKYALHAETYPRRAVAVATTNEADYWQDSTGARRLIPVACTDIHVDLIEAKRLQWFAEALHYFNNGVNWWEFPTAIATAQEERQVVDPWEDVLRHCIAHGRRVGVDHQGVIPWPAGWISSAEIMRDWLELASSQQGRASGVRLGHVMRRLGFKPKQAGKDRERGWIADTSDDAGAAVSAECSPSHHS